jgi:predicted Zn-dependent peptidase
MRRCIAFGWILLWGAAAWAGPSDKVATIEGVTEYRLANGARVLLFPEASRPTVTVNMTVLVGSRHEGYGESGMAHLLEHMVFKGTPDNPQIPKWSISQITVGLRPQQQRRAQLVKLPGAAPWLRLLSWPTVAGARTGRTW